MSLVAILGDPHFGARGDSKEMMEHQRLFYENVFFPYLKANGIKDVISMGDIFDRRKYINYATLQAAHDMFFDVLVKENIHHTCLVGNHDIYYRNTLKVNSPAMVIDHDPDMFCLVDRPLPLRGDVLSVPWICPDNHDEVIAAIQASKSPILLGHFEIKGFEMHSGFPSHDGLDSAMFAKFGMVLSGHFHKRSSSGNITYVGTPYQMTWSDYADKKGFHILDTDTMSLDFIENPYKMFHKIWYSDDANMEADFSYLKDTYVKVIVTSKNDTLQFERWLDKIYTSGPLQIQVIDDHRAIHQLSDEDIVNTAEDTRTILRKYIEGITTSVDKIELDKLVETLYTEAMDQLDNVSI